MAGPIVVQVSDGPPGDSLVVDNGPGRERTFRMDLCRRLMGRDSAGGALHPPLGAQALPIVTTEGFP